GASWRIDEALRPFSLNMESPRASHFSESASAHKLGQVAAKWNRPPMNPHLADTSVFPDRLDHATAFGDSQRERLLDIHVFAGVARLDCLESMPVIGRADHDRIDVFLVQQLSIIFESLGRSADLFGCKIQIGRR